MKRINLSILIFLCLLFNQIKAQESFVLVGKYDSKEDKGIAICKFDPSKNAMQRVNTYDAVSNPSYIIYDDEKSIVYVVEETASKDGGRMTSLNFDRKKGELIALNSVPTYGDHPCVLIKSPDSKYIIAGNYTGGNFSVYKLSPDGSIGKHVQTVNHKGESINEERQEGPHVHDLIFSHDGKYLLVADLGTDRVEVYSYKADDNEPFKWEESKGIKVPEGHGPRHIKFTNDGEHLIIVEELSETIGIASYDEGQLKYLETKSLKEETKREKGSAAEIQFIDGSDSFIVSNRGDVNELTLFKNDSDQQITFSAGVEWPRYFMVLPDKSKLMVAGQKSNNIVIVDVPEGDSENKTNLEVLKIDNPVFLLPLKYK
ncbi:lactonase family protein [Marinigracilibium pacificum]|uniref:Lactonase family protein n=1 Tax=Marinigracilibium pacificum TaxID=2729599 RepID=A0A848IXX7_9BACT|nr:lactonase family protein [Marinigracilibium pacificum]NMM48486.1 lactonase family protein [Marinigracilibium pacificum]